MANEPAPTLAEAIGAEDVLILPEAEDRVAVVRQIMSQLVASGHLTKGQASAATRNVNEREAVGSTAIGGGVALPHARVGFTKEIIAGFALLSEGKDFNALDGGSVRYVFLVLSPKEDDDLHVNFLKKITRFANVPMHLKALSSCHTAEEVHGVFVDYA